MLPTLDEWYKAAYYDPAHGGPEVGGYWNYPTGSDSAPLGVGSGTDPGTAVFGSGNRDPVDVTQAGGLSPYGTMGQGGNVWEWEETAWDLVNNQPGSVEWRGAWGGKWSNYAADHTKSSARSNDHPELLYKQAMGFRVACRPEFAGNLLPPSFGSFEVDTEASLEIELQVGKTDLGLPTAEVYFEGSIENLPAGILTPGVERLTFAGFVQSEGDFLLTANAQKLQIAPPPPLNSVQWAEIDGTFTLNSAEGGWIGGTGIAGKIIQRIDSTTTTTLYELPDIQNFKLYSYSKVEFESLNYAFDVGLLKFGAAEVAFLHDPPTIIPPYGGAFQLSIIGPYATVTDLFDEDNEDNEDKTWYFSDFDLDLSGPAGFDELIFSGDPLSLLGFKITPPKITPPEVTSPEITSPQINLVRTGNTLGLHLDGEMDFAGNTFTVEGDIASSGEANLTMALKDEGAAPSLGGFPLNAEASFALQISPPVAPATLPTAQVHVTGEMGFAGTTFTLDGDIQSSGEANLTMTLIGNDVPSLGGFPLNAGASLALQISPPVAPATLPTAQVHVTGEMGFAGATFNLDGYIQSSGQSILTMALIGNDVPSLGGFEIGADTSFELRISPGTPPTAVVHFDGAIENIPGIESLSFAGDIASDLTFAFLHTVENLTIAPFGTDEGDLWVELSGQLRLSGSVTDGVTLAPTSTVDVAVRKGAQSASSSSLSMLAGGNDDPAEPPVFEPGNPGLLYDLPSLSDFSILPDGTVSFEKSFDDPPFDLGGLGIFSLSAAQLAFLVQPPIPDDPQTFLDDPTGGLFQLTIGSPTLTVANVFGDQDWTRTGSNIEIDLNLGDDFECEVHDGSQPLSFGGFTLTGTDVWLIREDNVMKLRLVEDQPSHGFSPNSQLELPFNLGSFDIDTFEIASDGTFDLEILDPQIGPTVLQVSAEKMHFRNTTGGFDGLELFVDDPILHLPLDVDLDLPVFSFNHQGSVSQDLAASLFDFGNYFKAKDGQPNDYDFRLETTDTGEWLFKLRDGESVDLVLIPEASEVRLTQFEVNSSGNISGEVQADLEIITGGKTYAVSDTWELSVDDKNIKLETNRNVDLGFASMAMNVWMKSDGSYSLSHSASIDQSVSVLNYNVVRITGTFTVQISSANGFAAKVEGAKLEYMLDSDWFDLPPGLEPDDVEVDQDGSGILGAIGFTFLP